MKFFSFGIIVHLLLFGVVSFGQNAVKESLKSLELVVNSPQLDSLYNEIVKTSKTDSESLIFKADLDELMEFVTMQRQDKNAIFETNIQPFLERKLALNKTPTINFNDDEELIFESFITVLKWNKAIETVSLYEDFLNKNYKEKSKINNLLTVLSYIKQFHTYVYKLKTSRSTIYNCINKDIEIYNAINWKVFAMHYEAIILWTFATYLWEIPSESENK